MLEEGNVHQFASMQVHHHGIPVLLSQMVLKMVAFFHRSLSLAAVLRSLTFDIHSSNKGATVIVNVAVILNKKNVIGIDTAMFCSRFRELGEQRLQCNPRRKNP